MVLKAFTLLYKVLQTAEEPLKGQRVLSWRVMCFWKCVPGPWWKFSPAGFP